MTTKEFMDEVAKLKFTIEVFTDDVDVMYLSRNNRRYASVNKNEMYKINTMNLAFSELETDVKNKLYKLLQEYSYTPIEDRNSEVKYYLKVIKYPFIGVSRYNYLNYDYYHDELVLGGRYPLSGTRSEFTKKEVEDLDKKYNIFRYYNAIEVGR